MIHFFKFNINVIICVILLFVGVKAKSAAAAAQDNQVKVAAIIGRANNPDICRWIQFANNFFRFLKGNAQQAASSAQQASTIGNNTHDQIRWLIISPIVFFPF